jgi:hypothetical protein
LDQSSAGNAAGKACLHAASHRPFALSRMILTKTM